MRQATLVATPTSTLTLTHKMSNSIFVYIYKHILILYILVLNEQSHDTKQPVLGPLDNVRTFQISSERDETNKQTNLFENIIPYSTKQYYISRDVVMHQVSLILASTKFLCHFSSL